MESTPKQFVLTRSFTNFNEYGKYFSSLEEHFGVSWNLSARCRDGFLRLYLYCQNPKETSKWSVEVDFALKLISNVEGYGNLTREFHVTYGNGLGEHTSWGLHKFCDYENLNRLFLEDRSLTVEAHVTIQKVSGSLENIQEEVEKKEKLRIFDATMENFSDVVLNVSGEKFYVSKLYLASQSTYFKALFLRHFRESKEKEIDLPEVDPEDFQNFLELLYGESSIDESSVAGILTLANMYNCKTAFEKCQKFLMGESKNTLKEKLEMAGMFNMSNLKETCLSKINTSAELRSVLSTDFSDMNQSVLAPLLQKTLRFVP